MKLPPHQQELLQKIRDAGGSLTMDFCGWVRTAEALKRRGLITITPIVTTYVQYKFDLVTK